MIGAGIVSVFIVILVVACLIFAMLWAKTKIMKYGDNQSVHPSVQPGGYNGEIKQQAESDNSIESVRRDGEEAGRQADS